MSDPLCAPEPFDTGSLYLSLDQAGVVTAANAAAHRCLRLAGPGSDAVGQALAPLVQPGCQLTAALDRMTGNVTGCARCEQRLHVCHTGEGLTIHGQPGEAYASPGEALASALNTAQQVSEVARVILTHPAWEALGVQLALFDPVGAELRLLRCGRHGPEVASIIAVSGPHPLAAAFRTGAAQVSDPAAWRTPEVDVNPAAREILSLPLRSAERTLGQLMLTMERPGQLARLLPLLPLCSAALDRAVRFDEVSRAQLRYRTLLEISHAALWELDRNFAIQGLSPNWEALTGQTYEEYVGRGHLNVIHPDDRARVDHEIERGMLSGLPFELRGRFRRVDGQYRHGVALALPVPEERGNGRGWAGSIQDVTEEVWAAEWAGPAQQLLTLSVQGGPAQPTFQAVLDELRRVSGATVAALLRDARTGRARPLAAEDPAQQLQPLLEALTAEAVSAGVRGQTRPVWLRDLFGDLTLSGALLVPLRHEEQLVALAALDVPGGQLDATSLEHLRWLQGHLAPVVHSALLRDALERSEAQARSIVSAMEEGVLMIDAQGQFLAVNRAARDLLELPHVLPSVFGLDWGLETERGEAVPWEQHPVARALNSGRAVRQVLLSRRRREGERTWLSFNAIPLEDRSGVVLSCSDVTEAVTLRQKLTEQAFQDDLTGLGNRRAFQRAVRDLRGPRATALLIDVDHFKAVNDTYGHHAGDELLKELARRLQRASPPGALVARLGGDEFGVAHPDLGDAEITDTARRLVEVLGRPVQLSSAAVQVSASVGVASGAVPGGELHRAADLAMYAVKRSGKAGWRRYGEDLDPERVD